MTETRHFLDFFFNPSSIAVVGGSRNPLKIGYNLLGNLVNLKFPGRLYSVSPGGDEILGVKIYRSLLDIPDDIELVVCSVPASATLDVIKDCVKKSVKAVVIVAGGFSETGEQGKKVQAEIARLLKGHGIKAIGPNALSPIHTKKNLLIGFGRHQKLRPGKASFIFQSGLYEPRLDWLLLGFNLGIDKIIDLGNKIDITEVDALEYLGRDPDASVVGIHAESIAGGGRKFLKVLKETTERKPVVMLKSGRTSSAAKAASSHTGAMAQGSDAVFDGALRQTGAIRAQTMEEFFDFTKIFALLMPLTPRGRRIVLASLSGGEAVVTTDISEMRGLVPAQVEKKTLDRLQEVAPAWPITANPFDLGVPMQFHDPTKVYRLLLESMVEDKNVDCLALQLFLGEYEVPRSFFDPFLEARKKKPVALFLIESVRQDTATIEWLESEGIPVYPSGERAVKALAALYAYSVRQKAQASR